MPNMHNIDDIKSQDDVGSVQVHKQRERTILFIFDLPEDLSYINSPTNKWTKSKEWLT